MPSPEHDIVVRQAIEVKQHFHVRERLDAAESLAGNPIGEPRGATPQRPSRRSSTKVRIVHDGNGVNGNHGSHPSQ
jgi:hypothetical protein